MSLVWDLDISTSEKMVLLVLADHADDEGRNSWPSIATVARKSSVSPRQAQRILTSLKKRGLVRVEKQAGGNREMRDDRRPNRYWVTLDGVTSMTPRDDQRGDTHDVNGVTPMSPKPSIEPSNKDKSVPDRFDEFWKAYPNRVAKGAAVRAFKSALNKCDADTIIAAAAQYASDPKRDPEFTAHAATWLNGERWLDEVEPVKPTGVPTMLEQFADEPCAHGEPRGSGFCPICRSEALRATETA